MSDTITIEPGQRPRGMPNIGYARSRWSLPSHRNHLIALDTWNKVAFCGQTVHTTPLATVPDTITVCGTCASLLDLTASDFEFEGVPA